MRSTNSAQGGGGVYTYNYDCTIGDIIYCTGGNYGSGSTTPGYYKALQNTTSHVSAAVSLTNTDYFEYLGKSYQIPAVKLKAGKVKDAEGSGIKKYSFGISKDNGTTWTWEGEKEVGENVQEVENVEYIITGLVEGEKCLVKMQVEDRAGNKQES